MMNQKEALEIQASLNNAIQMESPPPVATPVATPVVGDDDWKPDRYIPPHLRKYVEADKLDAAQIQRWKAGDDMKNATRWLAPGIPTTYYAHTLAKEHGISHTMDVVFESKFEPGIFYACVWTFNPKNQRVQIGAAYWDNPEIAKFFAYRNSIRQQLTGLCLQIGRQEKKAYRTDNRTAAKRYA